MEESPIKSRCSGGACSRCYQRVSRMAGMGWLGSPEI